MSGLGLQVVRVGSEGSEGTVDSGIAGEDFPEGGEKPMANSVAAMDGVAVGVVLAPVVHAERRQVVAKLVAPQAKQGAQEADAAHSAQGAEPGQATGVGTAGEAEEETLDRVVGVMAEGDGVAGLTELAPEIEPATARGGLDALAGMPPTAHVHPMDTKRNTAHGTEPLAPIRVRIGLGSAQAMVNVVGNEGVPEFLQEQ
jgi:hypothetical protein